MYNFFLIIHSWTRWAVLILALVVIYRSFVGWQGRKAFEKKDATFGGIFIGLFHLQVLIGLVLYFFLSPIVQVAFADFGAAMKNAGLRFWAVEHIFGMVVAAIVAQVGRTKSKKAAVDFEKHKKAFIYYLIATVIVLLSMPYVIRPLFRI